MWPTASVAPEAAAAAIIASASASVRVIGFSTSTAMPRSQKRQRDLVVHLGRHRDGDGVDLAEQLAVVGRARASPLAAAISAARSGRVSTTAVRRDVRRLPASMRAWCRPRWPTPMTATRRGLSAMRHAPRRRCAVPAAQPAYRPTMAMPRLVGGRTTWSPSIISVLPASIESAVAPAALIASIVATPTTGTSKRMSWFGLATLTIATPRPARLSRPARSSRPSLPSPRRPPPPCPSRRSSGRCRAPRWRRPSGTRTRSRPPPSRRRARRVSTPSRASSGTRNAVESSSSMPSIAHHVGHRRDQRVGVPRLAAASGPTAGSGPA